MKQTVTIYLKVVIHCFGKLLSLQKTQYSAYHTLSACNTDKGMESHERVILKADLEEVYFRVA